MIIQYTEQGIFYDFIERDELAATIEARINTGIQMLNSNDADAMAAWLGYYNNQTAMHWRMRINERITHLRGRLTKLQEKANAADH